MAAKKASDTNEKYFGDYNNLQYVKHRLIREYLNGWYPKLGSWSGRILYFDTHAGRGEHAGGQSGSPVIALRTLLDHNAREWILSKSEARFFFIEENSGNVEFLRKAVRDVGPLPERMFVNVSAGNCFETLNEELDRLDGTRQKLAPAFVFVDPYGFTLPCETLRRLLEAGQVELFVNIIWRELFMGIGKAQDEPDSVWPGKMTLIFGSDVWKHVDRDAPVEDRENQVIEMLSAAYGAKWATSMRMLHDNKSTRYLLAHFSNHDSGRDLMKECMWKACPDGGFYAQRGDNPDQAVLLEPDPDLRPLEAWVMKQLADGPRRAKELASMNLANQWRATHLNKVLQKLRRDKRIDARDYEGKFALSKNPLFSLPG